MLRPNWICLFLCAGFMLAACVSTVAQSEAKLGQHDYVFDSEVEPIKYLLFLPAAYDDDPEALWPLIYFFHGAGENGDNLDRIKVHGPPMLVEKDPDFPFIVLSPLMSHTMVNVPWTPFLETHLALLEDVEANYRVDASRVYLTGLSQGGFVTWYMAAAYPATFAAIAPIAGGGNRSTACALTGVPVWAFHGSADSVVSVSNTEVMVEAIEDCGGVPKFTIYPGVGHNSWTRTYDNPELYDWFMSYGGVPTSIQLHNHLSIAWSHLKRL